MGRRRPGLACPKTNRLVWTYDRGPGPCIDPASSRNGATPPKASTARLERTYTIMEAKSGPNYLHVTGFGTDPNDAIRLKCERDAWTQFQYSTATNKTTAFMRYYTGGPYNWNATGWPWKAPIGPMIGGKDRTSPWNHASPTGRSRFSSCIMSPKASMSCEPRQLHGAGRLSMRGAGSGFDHQNPNLHARATTFRSRRNSSPVRRKTTELQNFDWALDQNMSSHRAGLAL